MKRPTELTITAWARLLRAHETALSTVETALKEADLPPLSWYDVLLELERVGDEGIRPYELQDKLLLPQYGLSRLLTRIEKAGYLERLSSEEDGRGQLVFITPSGRSVRARMWSVYAPAIEGAVGKKLTCVQAKSLSNLLGKLIA